MGPATACLRDVTFFLLPSPPHRGKRGNRRRERMAKQSSFLWHAAVYGGGNLLVYAAGFLLLPLYVRCLSESEYGTLDVFNRLGEVVILCLLYNGLRQALLAFHNQ